jgi:hypothetical protein
MKPNKQAAKNFPATKTFFFRLAKKKKHEIHVNYYKYIDIDDNYTTQNMTEPLSFFKKSFGDAAVFFASKTA